MLSSFIFRIAAPPVSAEVDLSMEDADMCSPSEQIIQVNVLNACGKTGLASEVKTYLLERGFDVVEIGNYSGEMENSVIIDRIGDSLSSKKVAYAMGIQDAYVTSDIDSSLFVRATVVIGKDYFSLKSFN
jgi:hypothetical protein